MTMWGEMPDRAEGDENAHEEWLGPYAAGDEEEHSDDEAPQAEEEESGC